MSSKTPYDKVTLKNGVRLMLIPMEGVNSVASAVMVGVGSRYETEEIGGISHFLEHMVFKGTKKFPTTEDVNSIERVGGLQNAYTDIDITNYHNKVLAEDWSLGLEINKELATRPLLEQKHVDKERDVIIEEMKRYEDEPSAKVGETFHSMLYPGTKLGRPIIGNAKSLHNVAAKELSEYHKQWYAPDRMVVVLAGAVGKPAKEIRQKAEEWFGGLAPQKTGDIEVVSEVQKSPNVAVVTKPDAQQAHINLGVRAFARGSEDRFAWNLFNLIMGVSFSSRLFKEIREKRGLCYHIRSSSDSWRDVGYWSIYAGVATAKVEETITATLHELSKVVDKGVTEAELVVAKKRLKTMLAFKSEDPEFMGEFYGRQELFHDAPMMTLPEYIEKMESMSVKDINKLLPKYIKQDTLNLAIVWNKKKDDSLEKLLRI